MMIANTSRWDVRPDLQTAKTKGIAQSLTHNKATARMQAEREAVFAFLGIQTTEAAHLLWSKTAWTPQPDVHTLFAHLLTLEDAQVIRILAFITAEGLPAGSSIVEALGVLVQVDTAKDWTPDDTFFDLMRDKPALNAMVREVAGNQAADTHITAPAKVHKKIIKDCLNGTRPAQVQNWHPPYMAFPMTPYTNRGGIDAIDQWNAVKDVYEQGQDEDGAKAEAVVKEAEGKRETGDTPQANAMPQTPEAEDGQDKPEAKAKKDRTKAGNTPQAKAKDREHTPTKAAA